jgi:hypothetical protein
MKTGLCVCALVVFSAASTDSQTLATLRVQTEKTAGGIVTLVLQSGNVIEVLESDLYGLVKGGLQAPLSETTPRPPFIAPPMPAPVAGPTSGGLTITDPNSRGPGIRVGGPGNEPSLPPSGQEATIRAKCAREWPTDFSVRAYCERTQREAVAKLQTRAMSTTDQRTIRSKCATEWPEDFSVRNYCEETQLKALATLGR